MKYFLVFISLILNFSFGAYYSQGMTITDSHQNQSPADAQALLAGGLHACLLGQSQRAPGRGPVGSPGNALPNEATAPWTRVPRRRLRDSPCIHQST